MRSKWASDYGDKQREIMGSDSYKNSMSNSIKEVWNRDDYRRNKAEQSAKLCSDPEFIDSLRESSKAAWQNDKYRDKVVSSIDSDAISKRSRLMWNDPDYRDRIVRHIQQRSKDPEYLRLLSEKSKARWQNADYRYNVLKNGAKTRSQTLSSASSLQKRFYKMLDSWGIKHEQERVVGYYNVDAFIEPDLLVEIQGDYWHLSVQKNIVRDKAKRTYIRKHTNYRLKYLWGHEFNSPGRIKRLLELWTGKLSQIAISKRDIVMRKLDHKECSEFLHIHHYLGKHSRGGINYGLYYNDNLIAVIVFSNAIRMNSNNGFNYKEVKEISRLCIDHKYNCKNLGSWFIAKAIKELKKSNENIKAIISFADSTYNHDGTIYKASNFNIDRIVKPDYWYEKDGDRFHKRTIWTHAKRNGMTESEFAKRFGICKMYGLEKKKYVLHL